MFRFLLELMIPILIAMVARAVLSSVKKSMSSAASGGFQQQQHDSKPRDTPRAGELHKDPVCGTFVSEATAFRRTVSGKTVYYCSDACRQKHAA
jgi:YHS domain-containing protein